MNPFYYIFSYQAISNYVLKTRIFHMYVLITTIAGRRLFKTVSHTSYNDCK